MNLHISLNGKDLAELNLTALDGILNALMKPSAYKKYASNGNAAINGERILSAPTSRMKDKRTISLPFLLQSTSLIDLQREIDNLEAELVAGKNGTGINELVVRELGQCYRLYYESMSSYTNFGLDGAAMLSIKFVEPNPTNRGL